MALPDAFRIVQVWRNSFHAPGVTPNFTGGWQLGDDWKREKWASLNTIIEVREMPFSRFYSVAVHDKRVYVRSNDLRTKKSRRSSQFFNAITRQPYDGPVNYTEVLSDENQ